MALQASSYCFAVFHFERARQAASQIGPHLSLSTRRIDSVCVLVGVPDDPITGFYLCRNSGHTLLLPSVQPVVRNCG
ncbi:unnamed protein product [Lactuca virosa]|uniref:Uncharacterized protein n=1 Tax=Lactuca virosa TaxID=75947 RepID=A0AAU9N1Q2_9ASTR|nr:unnamed protein product [Lactuca virosa]